MILQNLVFNKLGNSFSALLFYQNRTIQILDNIKTEYFEIKHICTSGAEPLFISLHIKEKIFHVKFSEDGFTFENFIFSISEEGFVGYIAEAEYIFKLSVTKTVFIKTKIEKEKIKVFLPYQDFFKGLYEFISSIEL